LAVDWLFGFVQGGSAVLSSGHGACLLESGDAVLVVPGTVFRISPDSMVEFTVLSVDGAWLDHLIYWHRDTPLIRRAQQVWTLPAWREPAIRHGTVTAAEIPALSRWMAGLVTSTAPGAPIASVAQVQALTFNVIDALAGPLGLDAPAMSWASGPGVGHHSEIKLRPEVHTAVELLRADPARRWTVAALASATHLSVSQLSRLFVAAFEHAPIAFLTVIRVHELAHLLRTTADPISECARRVGWADRSYAARQFRKFTGMSPSAYRALPIPGRGPSQYHDPADLPRGALSRP
jgi:AraC-like DNA-binding protein